MVDDLVEVEPCSERCARILARREHIALMVSPGNPYFSTARLTTLVRWAARETKGVDVVMSDLEMTAATYLGQGRSQAQAGKRARADVRQMASRVRRAVEAAGSPPVRVSEFEDWAGHPEYRRAHTYIRQAIGHPAYRLLYRRGTREALKARMPETWEPTEEQIDTGLLHSEKALPFIINAVGILGVPHGVVAYSRPTAQARYFFTETSPFQAFPGQGYIGLRVRA